eukprot:GHVL01028780.1.p1 GENE.GHVL01028780.1~~GHVL01028780.1.p1  ORF type:complete len:143 (+),score=23.91 GHVL01028780.1:50-478(+)
MFSTTRIFSWLAQNTNLHNINESVPNKTDVLPFSPKSAVKPVSGVQKWRKIKAKSALAKSIMRQCSTILEDSSSCVKQYEWNNLKNAAECITANGQNIMNSLAEACDEEDEQDHDSDEDFFRQVAQIISHWKSEEMLDVDES